uniref:L-lactate dehydrogenase n=1 Tax=Junco hyemalis TaxID=40217 RepID=A0A8C5IFI6_JUNHY
MEENLRKAIDDFIDFYNKSNLKKEEDELDKEIENDKDLSKLIKEVVGDGRVGSSADENGEWVKGFNEGCDYSICDDADAVVITSGAPQKPGQTRLELLGANASIVAGVCKQLKSHLNDHCVVIVVSNPCDVLAWVAYKTLGIDSKRVIGSGCVLDSSRLKQEIGDDLGIDYRSVNATIIGEHGDSEVAAYSAASIGTTPIRQYYEEYKGISGAELDAHLEKIHYNVWHSAYDVINLKRATNYAIALSITRICKAILTDEKVILPVSVLCDKHVLGGKAEGVYLSVPSILGANGVEAIVAPEYSKEDTEAVLKSAETLRENCAKVQF